MSVTNNTYMYDYAGNILYPYVNASGVKWADDGTEEIDEIKKYDLYNFVKKCVGNVNTDNVVTVNGEQTITGKKTFDVVIDGSIEYANIAGDCASTGPVYVRIGTLSNNINDINNSISAMNSSINDLYSNINTSTNIDLSDYITDKIGLTATNKFDISCNNININGNDISINGDVSISNDISVGGNIYASAFYESSDERLKTFKSPILIDLDELSQLKKSYFIFNEHPTTEHIGVSAQEIKKLYPEIIIQNENGILHVDYSKLSVIALAAIDVLYKQNIELTNRLNLIESKLQS